jgi:SAM-dependent methyltransferase
MTDDSNGTEVWTKGFWNKLKAGWYRRGLDYSDMAATIVPIILGRAEGARSVLDVGAGCGSLALPLGKAGLRVTALDPSKAMLDILAEDARKEGLKNIKPVQAGWGEVELKRHDVVLCANVPVLLKGSESFLAEACDAARKYVFIIESADPGGDKFYYKELYPLIWGKPFPKRDDYLRTYTTLHSMGIFANVELVEYDFDQPFDDITEALGFWKEYMGIVTEEHDAKLREYLDSKLVKKKGVLLARFHKKAAVMWWRTGRGG